MRRVIIISALLSVYAIATEAQNCSIKLTLSVSGAPVPGAIAASTAVTVTALPTCDLDQITYVVKDGSGNLLPPVTHSKKITTTDGDTFTFTSATAQVESVHASGNPFQCQICTAAVGDSNPIVFFAATDFSPKTGTAAGGNAVTVTGGNFPTSGCIVNFGQAHPAPSANTATSITVTAPPAPGPLPSAVTVSVTCNNTTSTVGGNYTYAAANPTLTGISPSSGLLAGGNTATLSGTDFTSFACTKVTFGGVNATNVKVVNDKTITAVVPSGAVLGAVDVALDCVSTVLTKGYTYGVSIVSITPSPIPTKGGVVTVKGTGVSDGCAVWFGSRKGTGLTAVNGTTDTFTVSAPDNPNVNPVGDPIVPVVISCGDRSVDRTQGAPFLVSYAAAAFTYAPGDLVPNVVQFTNVSSGSPILKWDFGDGSPSESVSPVTHPFSAPGPYVVTLTATYPGGATSTSKRVVTVVGQSTTFTPNLIVPGQGRIRSAQGFFKSQFWATNRSVNTMVLRLRFVPADSTDAPTVAVVTIAKNASLAYSDVLWQVFGKDSGVGNVVVETSDSTLPLVSARTYADSSFASTAKVGSSGQFIPSFPLSGDYPSRAMLSGLAPANKSRSNLGIVNLSDGDMTFKVEILDENGTSVGVSGGRTVHSKSLTQPLLDSLFPGQALPPSFSVVVTPDSPGPFFAYLSKLDNVTQDPIFVPSNLPARNEQWIHPVAAAEGANAVFNTSLLFEQPDASAAVRITESADQIDLLELIPTGGAASTMIDLSKFSDLKAVFDVKNASKFYENAFDQALASVAKGAFYTLHLTSKTPLISWARLFGTLKILNDTTQNFGQFAPAFGRTELIDSPGAVLQGVSQDDASYTNFALINVTDVDVTMTVTLFNTDGLAIGGPLDLVVPAHQATPFKDVGSSFPNLTVSGGYLLVVPKDDAARSAAYAWASVNDRASSDSIYVRPQQLPADQPRTTNKR